jgi:opacity protein-like surface antigen
MSRRSIGWGVFVLLSTVACFAQESRSELSLQGNGLFTKSASGSAYTYSPTETGGFLIAYRYRLRRRLSAELVYGFNRDTQKYSYTGGSFGTQSNNHQATAGLVEGLPSFGRGRFSPYVLAAGGALIISPRSHSLLGVETQPKPTFVYGGGVNYALSKRISFRVEYRGLVYSAPNFGESALNTSITHSALPSVGLAFHF